MTLGECPAPDTGAFAARFGVPCDIARVYGAQYLHKALDAALAESNTLLLLGGFQAEDLPPLAQLTEMLSQSLSVAESNMGLRLIGQEDDTISGAVLSARGIRVYACSAVETRREAVLEEIQKHIAPVPKPSPGNAWLPPAQPVREPAKLSKPTRLSIGKVIGNRFSMRTLAKQPVATNKKPLLTILVAALLAFSVGVGYLIYFSADSGLQDSRSRAVQALYPGDSQDGERAGDGTLRQFEALRRANSDCVGWLSIPGAGVNLPVMLESTNSYYLTHDAQGKRSRFGALFLDSDNEVVRGRQSRNLSVFGHNTKNGSMFGQLHRYRDLSFYRQHAVFQFDTLYIRRQWVVFAVFITNANPVQDYGARFEWREQSSAAPENIAAFAAALKQRSILDTGVDVQPGDYLLSLTTCTYEIKDGRLVVFARALRPGETPPDPARARENPAPLYPAAWYVNYGGEKPDVSVEPG